MAEPFDRLLLDPDEGELAAALEQAARRRAQWRPLLAEVAGHAEGRVQVEQLRGTHYVSVAWWTDHQGRKHVRVAGSKANEPGWQPHHSQLDQDLRPPLWHVCRERTFRVTRLGQEPVWVVSCACGMTGAPEALAWMGPRCGPCHDRVEEGQPHPEEKTPTLFARGTLPIHAAPFAPDGRRLAVASGDSYIDLFSLDGGPEQRLYGDQDTVSVDGFRTLVFSPEGRSLAAGEPEEQFVRVWNLSDGDDQELVLEDVADSQVLALAFSPDGRLLVACTADGVVKAWQLDERDTWQHLHSTDWDATSLAFAPNGQTLAVGRRGGRVDFVDPATWKRRGAIETKANPGEDVLFVHFIPDRLVVVTGDSPRTGNGNLLQTLSLGHRAPEHSTRFPFDIAVIAPSPCGRYLAWVVHDDQHSPGEITFWDLQRWQEAGRLEWDPEDPLLALDFSPDGQTLVTGSSAGVVKLWPWRLLLEG
jgi:WD40 repeat protein